MNCTVRSFALLQLLLLAACQEDEDPPAAQGSTSGEATSGAVDESSSGAPASPFDCVEQNFQPTPLAGPGLDPETGAIIGAPQNTYVLHTTQAVVTPETAEALLNMSNEVAAQAMATEGLVALSFSMDQTCGYARTLGIWESEEAMLGFVVSGAHAEAMRQAPNIISTGRFTHFDIPTDDIERAWEVALERLETVEPIEGY